MKSLSIALKNKIKSLNKRKVVVSAIFGLFLSISFVIGKQMNDTHTIEWSFSTVFNLLFVFCYVVLKKNYKYLVPISFIFGMLLTVFLSPVILYRYLFPVILTIPIMFYIIMVASKDKKGSNAKK